MNTLNKTHAFQNCRACVRRLCQAAIQTIAITLVTIVLIFPPVPPPPGIPIAPGSCTSTSGECGTSINA